MAQAISKENPEVKALQQAIRSIDSSAAIACSEVSTMAKMALLWLERPEGYYHTEAIATILRAIWFKADELENSINFDAEEVGCASVDAAFQRRCEAYQKYQNAKGTLA